MGRMKLSLKKRVYHFSERRQDIVQHFRDSEPIEPTFCLQPAAQVVGHLTHKKFLFVVSAFLFFIMIFSIFYKQIQKSRSH